MANKMEIIIKQDEGVIRLDNYDEIKNYLADRLEEFSGVTFTDDAIKDAKVTIAQLRKERDGFKAKVVEAKNVYMSPFEQFRKRCEELIAMYEEPIDFINYQVQDFEERRKADKKDMIARMFDDITSEYTEALEYVTLEKIANPKWENATYTTSKIKDEIAMAIQATDKAINTIKDMGSEAVGDALKVYKNTLKIEDAIDFINKYEKQKAIVLSRQTEKPAEPTSVATEIPEIEDDTDDLAAVLDDTDGKRPFHDYDPRNDTTKHLFDFRVFVTHWDKAKLMKYMNDNDIQFEEI